MKEVNKGWGFFRKKLQDYDMPAEKGDWAEFEQMFDKTPPPTPTAPNGGSSLFGGIAGKLIGFAMIVSVAGIALFTITSGSGTTNDNIQNSNQSIISPNSTDDNNSTIETLNSNLNQHADKTLAENQDDADQATTNEKIGSQNIDQYNSSNPSLAKNANEENRSASNTATSASSKNNGANTLQAKYIGNNINANNKGLNTNNNPENAQRFARNNSSDSNALNSGSNAENKLNPKEDTNSNEAGRISGTNNSGEEDQYNEKENTLGANSNTSAQSTTTSSLLKDKENQEDDNAPTGAPSFDWDQDIQELPKGNFQIPFLNGPDHSIDAYIDALIGPTKTTKKNKRPIDLAVSTGFAYSSSAIGKKAAVNPFIAAHIEIPVFKRGGIEIGLQHYRMGNFTGIPETEIILYNGIESERTFSIRSRKYDFVRLPIKYKHYLNNKRIALSAGISISGEGGYDEENNVEIVNTTGTTSFNSHSNVGYDFSFTNLGLNLGAEYQLSNKFSMYVDAELTVERDVYDINNVNGEISNQAPGLVVAAGLKWHALHFKKDKIKYLALKAVGGSTIGIGSNNHSFSTSYLFGGNISYRFGKTWEVETGLEIFRVNGYKNADPFERTNNIAGGIKTNFFEPISTWKLQAKYPLRIKKHFNEKWVGYAGVAFSDAYDYNSRIKVTTSFSNSSIVNNSVQTTGADIVITNDNAWSLSLGGEYKIYNGLSIFGDLEYYVIDGHRSAGAATGPLVNTGIKYTLFRL